LQGRRRPHRKGGALFYRTGRSSVLTPSQEQGEPRFPEKLHFLVNREIRNEEVGGEGYRFAKALKSGPALRIKRAFASSVLLEKWKNQGASGIIISRTGGMVTIAG